jgi:hypothetical protein
MNGRWYVVTIDRKEREGYDLGQEVCRLRELKENIEEEIRELRAKRNELREQRVIYHEEIDRLKEELSAGDTEIARNLEETARIRRALEAVRLAIEQDFASLDRIRRGDRTEVLKKVSQWCETDPDCVKELDAILTKAGVHLDTEKRGFINPHMLEMSREGVLRISEGVIGADGMRALGTWLDDPRRLAVGYCRFLSNHADALERPIVEGLSDQSADKWLTKLFAGWRKAGVPHYVIELRRVCNN